MVDMASPGCTSWECPQPGLQTAGATQSFPGLQGLPRKVLCKNLAGLTPSGLQVPNEQWGRKQYSRVNASNFYSSYTCNLRQCLKLMRITWLTSCGTWWRDYQNIILETITHKYHHMHTYDGVVSCRYQYQSSGNVCPLWYVLWCIQILNCSMHCQSSQ